MALRTVLEGMGGATTIKAALTVVASRPVYTETLASVAYPRSPRQARKIRDTSRRSSWDKQDGTASGCGRASGAETDV